MDVALEIRAARSRVGLNQGQLARAASTSQATVSAYESGRKQPSIATAQRLLSACGASLEVRSGSAARLDRAGRELADVLALAEALPYRPSATLDYPRLPT